MNKQKIIKKILLPLIFLLSIIALIHFKELKQYNNEVYYEIKNIEKFTDIDVEIDNLILNIIPTSNSYIKISRDTRISRFNVIGYSSNYSNGKLKINKFIKGNLEDEAKDVLNVEIPINSNLKNLNIQSNNSEVNINQVTSKSFNIDASSYLKLSINNSIIDNALINSDEIHSNILNSNITENIEYNISGGEIKNKNVSGNKEEITNIKKLNYKNESSNFSVTNFNSSDVSLDFLLNGNAQYEFKNAINKEKKNKLKTDENGTTFYYNDTSQDIKHYIINCNNNKITNINIEEKEAIRSDFER